MPRQFPRITAFPGWSWGPVYAWYPLVRAACIVAAHTRWEWRWFGLRIGRVLIGVAWCRHEREPLQDSALGREED